MEILFGELIPHPIQTLTNYPKVFIVVCAIGSVWAYFAIPETKGVPLEELAAIFGDDDEVVVYMKDIHVDMATHELIVDKSKGTAEFGRVATEPQRKKDTHHVEEHHAEDASPSAHSEKDVEAVQHGL